MKKLKDNKIKNHVNDSDQEDDEDDEEEEDEDEDEEDEEHIMESEALVESSNAKTNI